MMGIPLRAGVVRWLVALMAACVLAGMGALPALASATPSPAWSIHSVAGPTNFMPGDASGTESYKLYVTNLGSQATDGSMVTITDTLPPGVTPGGTPEGVEYKSNTSLSCTEAPVQCTYSGVVPAGDVLEMDIRVAIDPSASGSVTNTVTVTGGGAAASTSVQNPVSVIPAPFGINNFSFGVSGLDGMPDTQAGAHPYAVTTTLDLNSQQFPHGVGANEVYMGVENVKDVVVDLPLGFVGSALAAPQCPLTELEANGFNTYHCPANTKIGEVTLRSVLNGIASSVGGSNSGVPVSPLFNMVPEHGHPAEFGFAIGGVLNVHLYASVVHTSAGYVLRATTPDIPAQSIYVAQKGFLTGITLTLFGDPASQDGGGNSPVPFFTNPVDCSAGSSVVTAHVDTWSNKGRVNPDGMPDFSDPNWVAATSVLPPVTGCDALQFEPGIALTPDSAQAGSPTGLTADVRVPQAPNNDFALATPALKNAVVTLPAGMSVSPSAAGGLGVCSLEEIGLDNTSAPSCPDASKVGTVQALTPILGAPLTGSVYVAQQTNNPFGSLFALYLVLEGSGVLIKVPGEVRLDPATGQVRTTFKNLPEQPVSDIKLHLFGGPRAVLSNPSGCGTYTTTSQLTPYSSETPAEPSSSFEVTGCGAPRFEPSFTAGTANNQAGAFSPFSVTFSRTDQDQGLAGVTVQTPPGLLGMLSQVPLCGEPQAAQGTCGAQSLIGHTTVGAGAGPDPVFVGGQVFLTGPYKGAPFGLSIVVPAAVGPFNLGTVVVRSAINVDPHTAQITVVSDPLPRILQGVPLQVKTVNVSVDRPGFMFNPTSCEPFAVGGTLSSTQGASAQLSSRFQAANCANLPFKPRFSVSTQAKTSKGNGASLEVRIGYPSGAQANIHSVAVSLPKQLPSRLTTIQQACPEALFNQNPASCPAGSLIGMATAATPVLNVPLTGPAYLVSHGGAAFPDLVIILQGQGVTFDLIGSINIKKGVTSSTFASVPDAPISSFDLVLPQGPHSALASNLPATAKGSLCGQSLVMPTTITGQNGAQIKQSTKIGVTGCPKARKAKRHHGKHRTKKSRARSRKK